MNVAPSEAGDLTLYEYGALLHYWNKRNKAEGDDDGVIEPFDPAQMEAEWADIEARGIGTMVH